MATKTTLYVDTLFFQVLLRAIQEAKSSVQLTTFLFKTSYLGDTRAQQILNALIAAAERGVRVMVILNYSRFEPDVAAENYATAQKLVDGGARCVWVLPTRPSIRSCASWTSARSTSAATTLPAALSAATGR